ncbi:MAG: D-glycero-beta-D-manno-heptose-7-phosphate kinase [Candidatus Marinimicrobia bacterium]|jgi:D-beta-D-heptose 7-phosphate kinase/D-beta-D-heptose 1-phosphate adenosyltransferase|nr:D-glycero-beta-D-manno-heptose-7-phosphate kinase [Candidatus Neomarinimicrobiota bacterium]MDP6457520.1 D-glycero-beta-D-manno-heptose-7-phosphate kinase [Candidatus Neomarinimicrobiota bacterium]MDP6593020.1 D-glycero-beta-D-manno-heptose-7-phosphate kinase [Candidatus Neomarinimicrobiota bacterium]MDP6835731.1 D-glycero-beta-D-manno-heptose-7-phosphate kinase [Candidatus Neomarinimicrobiota bacterium]MDP6965744.1 D-glycero-beta-D-manno-heptose-7-phosphate kinase [Candidatus Neomarinimicro|tara:strand:+ start:12890 stop:13873 length:984 start_codon:yes stop_codon:yes gene_type:complete
MKSDRYRELESHFESKKVLVVGDLMLDNYLWGDADRISPEAPVPVVKISSSSANPGGAGNVAYNLSSLGADAHLVGVVGDDKDGTTLHTILKNLKVNVNGIIADPGRQTTVKTRIIAHSQQVVRTDWETSDYVADDLKDRLLAIVNEKLAVCDAVILQDYNKGVLSPQMIEAIISTAREQNVPIYADPKFDHFFSYANVTMMKPNLGEASQAAGVDLTAEGILEQEGPKLRQKLDCELLLITRGEKGMSLFDGTGHRAIPTKARQVHDVSGAGDTVIATFSLSHIAGGSPDEAAEIAIFAAGAVCEEVGVVPITKENLHEIIISDNV